MKKIDAHAHIVQTISGFNKNGRLQPLGNGRAIWDTGEVITLIPEGYGDTNFTAESFIKMMDENGIEKAVILQGHLNGYQNYYTYQSIKKYPDRFIGAFSIDPFTKEAMKILERYVEVLGFRAIKFEISEGGGIHGYRINTPFRLDIDSMVMRILHYLSNYPGFVVTIDYGNWDQISYQPEAIANIAKLYPKLDFVVCHLSFPHSDKPERLKADLNILASSDNIYVDLSAIQDIDSPDKFPFPKAEKNVRLAKEILGSKHILWGSDVPWSATFNSYSELSTWLEHNDIFSKEELEDVMYNNAQRIYFKKDAVEAIAKAVDFIK